MNYFESNPCSDSNYSGFDQIEPSQYSVNPSLNIQNELDNHELFINELIQQKLQNEYAQPFPAIAIIFDLPTVEPEDSLRMGDEHLDTISKTELDEFIESSVENLVTSPSESKDDRNLFEPSFDEEIISIKIDLHHFNAESDLIESLLNHDSSIISSSSKIDSLLDEFAGELILLKSIPPGIDKADCDPEEEIRLNEILLYDNSSPRPPKEFILENSDVEIESFSPSSIPVEDGDSLMEEIDYLLLRMTRCHRELKMITMTQKGISLKNCLAMILFYFLKTSHFISMFHHPLALLQNLRMMMKLSPSHEF
uniref:Reverse transcriptase domain-containing protein n=1 Tax=Tanacetum cinerariifolium TaxID=118510 RepID=A0A699GIM4_TANCI|nr:hypothetical protein [Tanacetum cinerariifolium]